ncbi:MAG: DNA phosphorothioation-associated protein 4 [Okeania sp. SIO3I5]|uniref:DNA phosphorothioation-associated protein 4 n=1 Tax=Okeania sp. SIO3I5 TaxID=2607805 RepID=UPI0013BA7087|nr:DNA phosphorothioation-associated protein 4 [Okeania sp. SIO3I5]NEQ38604.1 DNA phosphorothioation-associated protein 4 [Okeania sp. SIO3I5]
MNRIKIAKDKADLVKALTESEGKTGPFKTYADVIVFAASLAIKKKKRIPVTEISPREPGPINIEVFWSRGYESIIKLIAIADTRDTKILSQNNEEIEENRIKIFEEYANGGLEILQDELRGAVNYSERLLLVLISERYQKPQPEAEFDLTKFLG